MLARRKFTKTVFGNTHPFGLVYTAKGPVVINFARTNGRTDEHVAFCLNTQRRERLQILIPHEFLQFLFLFFAFGTPRTRY